jgi:N4-gp56 family major capsid protein
MTLTTTTSLDNLLPTYFVRQALDTLYPKAVFYAFARKTPLPRGQGKVVRWNAWSNFSPVSVALTEGTNPTAAQYSSRKVEATLAQYGRVISDTDLVDYTSSLDVIKGVVENLSEAAALSIDKVIMNKAIFKVDDTLASNESAKILSAWMSCTASGFHAGSNAQSDDEAWGFPVIFGTTATRLSAAQGTDSVSARLSMYAIDKVVTELQDNNAMEFADGNFKGITRSRPLQDLMHDPDFKDWHKYTSSKYGEKGSKVGVQGPTPKVEALGVTFYASNNMPQHKETHSCQLSFIFGKGAYGVSEFGTSGKKGFQIIIKRPGPNDTSNALDMFGTIGFKFNLAAKALNVSSGRILITQQRG